MSKQLNEDKDYEIYLNYLLLNLLVLINFIINKDKEALREAEK